MVAPTANITCDECELIRRAAEVKKPDTKKSSAEAMMVALRWIRDGHADSLAALAITLDEFAAAEREACAKIVERNGLDFLAAQIRARGSDRGKT
jgi:hypothetical protein